MNRPGAATADWHDLFVSMVVLCWACGVEINLSFVVRKGGLPTRFVLQWLDGSLPILSVTL